ncbi:regulatory protein GemA [Sulfitobacter sp. F26204]|uniref:regulatory protein GemA n=1 Tax=Sulfitobacter sp. F26204 TaxID=2996014 RepID=UPI00225E1080|nr:regulatory protein GemA [Sulfitobacter sp. F26204]MCX7559114.1 regulatory protein GemA [Sulfitobacter sp. F26204]
MKLTNKQKALLHVAKGKLNLSEAEYRATLVHIAGVTSSTELDRDGFNAVMGFFEYLGFAPLVATGADYGNRPGMASFAQLELVRALWHEYTGGKAGEDELNKWLLGTWKISSLRFLRKDTAQKVITALKAMKARAA